MTLDELQSQFVIVFEGHHDPLICPNLSREHQTQSEGSTGYDNEHVVDELSTQITLLNG